MSYAALLAEGGNTATQAPWWLSGVWGLVGTGVGGVITFITTRSAHKAEQAAQRERHRKAQITDVSTRFIQAVSKQSVESMKLKETIAEYQSKLADALKEDDPAAALAKLQNDFAPAASAVTDASQAAQAQLRALTGFLANVATSESTLSELQMLVSETRLVMPNDVVRIAELVSTVTYTLVQSSSVLPLGERLKLGGIVTTALNVFVNAVRHEVGLTYYISEETPFEQVPQRLTEYAERQKN